MSDENEDHVVSPVIYIVVLAVLMALLALTVFVAFVDLDKLLAPRGHQGPLYWNMTIALLIAICKAILIILFFMHVKYSSKITWAFAAAGFVWLGIMITLTMSDYLTRGYPTAGPKSAQMSPSDSYFRAPYRHDPVVPGASAAPIRPDATIALIQRFTPARPSSIRTDRQMALAGGVERATAASVRSSSRNARS
jgi:cytochrome c oxidase subunit 4